LQELREIVELTRELVRKASHPQRRTIALSPETAAYYESAATTVKEEVAPAPVAVRETAEPYPRPAPNEPADDLEGALQELAREVESCTKCELCRARTQTVFGDGSPRARLVFVGEAPGQEEDRTGVPFVGRAGQLLTDIIVKGMQMRREEVYICNVIKCRPPENRDPLPREKEQCEPYLIRQVELIRPKVICALGRHAASTLLKTDEPTGRLRGKWHFYRGIPLRVTYHPAYLLRNPSEKRAVWDDIRHVMRMLRGEEVVMPPASAPEQPGLFT
jgi:DNA polymerase